MQTHDTALSKETNVGMTFWGLRGNVSRGNMGVPTHKSSILPPPLVCLGTPIFPLLMSEKSRQVSQLATATIIYKVENTH